MCIVIYTSQPYIHVAAFAAYAAYAGLRGPTRAYAGLRGPTRAYVDASPACVSPRKPA